MDRGAQWATVHKVTKSQTRLWAANTYLSGMVINRGLPKAKVRSVRISLRFFRNDKPVLKGHMAFPQLLNSYKWHLRWVPYMNFSDPNPKLVVFLRMLMVNKQLPALGLKVPMREKSVAGVEWVGESREERAWVSWWQWASWPCRCPKGGLGCLAGGVWDSRHRKFTLIGPLWKMEAR